MPKQDNAPKKPVLLYAIIAILLIAVILLLYSNSQAKSQPFKGASGNWTTTVINSGSNNSNYASLQANYSMEVSKFNSLKQNYSALLGKYNSSGNNTSQEVVQVLYQNKTIHLSAPIYNPNYNRVTGCYWIDGYENFSFYAPYSGYVVFNETNNGIPTNFTSVYFSATFSTEKPRYVLASPYNGSYWCSGETVQSNVAPYTQVTPFNNQTMIIPVRNGTNYFILYNGNANQQFGVNPFPINVTFSMKYYGFKGTNYMPAPSFNVNKTVVIDWGKYS